MSNSQGGVAREEATKLKPHSVTRRSCMTPHRRRRYYASAVAREAREALLDYKRGLLQETTRDYYLVREYLRGGQCGEGILLTVLVMASATDIVAAVTASTTKTAAALRHLNALMLRTCGSVGGSGGSR